MLIRRMERNKSTLAHTLSVAVFKNNSTRVGWASQTEGLVVLMTRKYV